jgi:hypothetical protein
MREMGHGGGLMVTVRPAGHAGGKRIEAHAEVPHAGRDPGLQEMAPASWGDILLAVTAVAAAAIAAVTAVWRMRRELQHDREMKVADELRSVVDAAEVAISVTAEAIGDVYSIHEGVPVTSLPNATLAEAVAVARSKTAILGNHWQRLMLRFDREHEIPRRFWEVRDAFQEALKDFGPTGAHLSEEELKASHQAYRSSADKNVAFVDACATHVSVIPGASHPNT